VIGWTELLYCRANSFEAIFGIHDALPEPLVLEALVWENMQNAGAASIAKTCVASR
jgi:hypothetical protein